MTTVTLDRDQQQAANLIPIDTAAVIAGAGSGKTRLLAAKIVADQKTCSCSPDRQVVVTFTNKAADELRDRIRSYGGSTSMRHLGTLHSFALREMRRADLHGITSLTIVGDRLFNQIVREECRRMKWKGTLQAARESAANPRRLVGNLKVIGAAILARCLREGVLHPDLILGLFAGRIDDLTDFPAGCRFYVDEYQDSSPTDAKIYQGFVDHHAASRFVVGDPRQAIYGFRGASPVLLEQAWLAAGESSRAQLRTNYRSAAGIVELGNQLACQMHLPPGCDSRMINPPRSDLKAWLTRTEYVTAEAEAEEIADWLKAMHQIDVTDGDAMGFGGVAILCRYNQQVRQVSAVLRAHRIPVTASTDHEDESEVMLRNEDLAALANATAETAEQWESLLMRTEVPVQLRDRLVPRLARCRCGEDVLAVLRGEFDPEGDKVTVSTIHQAKGLEWPVVWLAGADDKAFPAGCQETLRLLYVAVTRSKGALRISHASSRQSHLREVNLQATTLITI